MWAELRDDKPWDELRASRCAHATRGSRMEERARDVVIGGMRHMTNNKMEELPTDQGGLCVTEDLDGDSLG